MNKPGVKFFADGSFLSNLSNYIVLYREPSSWSPSHDSSKLDSISNTALDLGNLVAYLVVIYTKDDKLSELSSLISFYYKGC